uniref:Uncharacterized protein n=1 Tax=Romanomermis culicivorax TaxID=13658 RepID=A0A915K624_ROMCU
MAVASVKSRKSKVIPCFVTSITNWASPPVKPLLFIDAILYEARKDGNNAALMSMESVSILKLITAKDEHFSFEFSGRSTILRPLFQIPVSIGRKLATNAARHFLKGVGHSRISRNDFKQLSLKPDLTKINRHTHIFRDTLRLHYSGWRDRSLARTLLSLGKTGYDIFPANGYRRNRFRRTHQGSDKSLSFSVVLSNGVSSEFVFFDSISTKVALTGDGVLLAEPLLLNFFVCHGDAHALASRGFSSKKTAARKTGLQAYLEIFKTTVDAITS